MDTCDQVVGERIQALRRRRGLSRKTLAGLVGRSQEWLRQVEKGARRMDSIEVLLRMSEVLRADDLPQLLLGFAHFGHPGRERPGRQLLELLRLSLFRLGSSPRETAEEHPGAAPTLTAETDWLWREWAAPGRRFEPIGRKASDLLLRSWQTCGVLPCHCQDELRPACRAHVRMLLLLRSLLGRLGEHDLAYFAVHQAALHTRHHRTVQPEVECGPALAQSLSRLGCPAEAMETALAAVRRHAGASAGVRTALHLSVAEVAALSGDQRTCEKFLASAGELAADPAGGPPAGEPVIGSASLPVRKALCLLHLGQADLALHLAEEAEADERRTTDEVVDLHLALSRTWAARRDDVTALLTLLRVERLSPDDLFHNRAAADLLDTLQQSAVASVRTEASRLADRVGPAT